MPVQESYNVNLRITHQEYLDLHGTLHKHSSAVVIDKLQRMVIEDVNRIIAQDEDFYVEYTKKVLKQPPYDK